jgi:hypothetical protein
MAEIAPDEGIDYDLNTFPRATQSVPTTLYLGLFTSQTSTTVPSRDAVLASGTGTSAPVEVTSSGAYARAAVANTNWPAPATSGSGRRTTIASPGISFTESTGAWSAAVNGFILATALTAGIALGYSNFSDGLAVTVNAAGFTIRVAPYWHYDG